MSATVTFRLDPETARVLEELTQGGKVSKSRVIKSALRARAGRAAKNPGPSAREAYASMNIPHVKPKHDRARHMEVLLKEILLEKKRKGTF